VISFRYHIVSIVAVFLALALGIVVGTTALNGPVTTDLRNQVKSLKSDRGDLSGQVQSLQTQVDNAGQFASTFGSALVAGRLKDQKVLMVALPGASSGLQDSVAAALSAAGASLTGRLQLASDYVDQSAANGLNAFLTGGVLPAGATYPQGTDDARILGAYLLAYVLLGKGQQTDLQTVLTGFAGLHMITSDPKAIEPSTTVVLVATGTQGKDSYAGRAGLDLATALQTNGAHVIVAGDAGSATEGGVVALVRGGGAHSSVSTVDDADTAFGPASVVLTVEGALNSQIGHYGTAQGADALFPTAS